ncbi:MAG: phosphatidate cytidylyltransferase [Firmicutes bacterium HGW-Firmicutes-14]|nr:MAG: phosphatidate cytidylyltransferase [Firmicutes bacterium HGW-Firmicutes-14]
MLLYRVLSAMVGIPVMLFLVWYGGIPFSAALFLLVVVAILEMSRFCRKVGLRIWLPGAVGAGTVYVTVVQWGGGNYLGAALFAAVVMNLIYLIKTYPSFSLADMAVNLFVPLYSGWLLTHLISIRHLPDGFHFVILVLAATWSTDTFAYFVGSNLGRRKLAPSLSPNKSIEGALGGVVGSVSAALVTGLIKHPVPLVHYIIIGLLVGIAGQVGDLVESAFKRLAGVKDSGSVIPGHGGVLDRFDSLILTAPVVYYYLSIIVL